MGKRKSLTRQVRDRLNEMFQPGRSKHADKLANHGKPDPDTLYSFREREAYTDAGVLFTRWCKERYGERDLDDCRKHVPEYLMERRDTTAASTVHGDAAGLAKIYHCGMADFGVKLPPRERGDYVKNRGDKWKGHYSRERHPNIHTISEGSGVRRREMAELTPDNVVERDGRVWLENVEGKGGKIRDILVRQEYGERILALAEEARAAGRSTILGEKIPSRAPIHADRGQHYAWGLYKEFARPIDEIPRSERYYCRKDMRGQIFDKNALWIVTESLGHDRLCVVMNYLRK